MRVFLLLLALCLPSVAASAQKVMSSPRSIVVADIDTDTLALVNPDGSFEWKRTIRDLHDLHVLDNGHVLYQETFTHLIEWDPATDTVVWEYDSGKMNGNEGKRVEVHAFQRLANGNTAIFESGPTRMIEVTPAGELVREVKLQVARPDAHRDTRLARVLDNGHLLCTHEGEGVVREYDLEGNVVWEFQVPLFNKEPRGGHGPGAWGNQCFGVLRRANGNTLISTGNGHGLIEVTPEKRIIWGIKQNDLPGITLAWTTTIQELPNGNIVLGNCHAGPENPQIVEITRSKRVVWTFKDHERFGNSTVCSVMLPRSR